MVARPCSRCGTPTPVSALVEAHYGYVHPAWQHADAVVWVCAVCRQPNTAPDTAPMPPASAPASPTSPAVLAPGKGVVGHGH